MKKKVLVRLPKQVKIVCIEMDDEELAAFNIVHHALIRNGYTCHLQKISLKKAVR